MMLDLEEVAVALDAFPHWDENMRAEVFHAIDVAPSNYGEIQDQEETYFRSEAHASWKRVRRYVLKENDGHRWALELYEASGYESSPTKKEILLALGRGARMIR